MAKTVRLILTPLVLLGLLAVLGLGAMWGYESLRKGPGPKAADLCVMTDVGGELKPEDVSVRVFNGGKSGGLAKRTSSYLIAAGFRSLKVNNVDREIRETIVVGNAADDPEVKLVMGFFDNAIAEGDGRTDHVVDVLVGSAYAVREPPTATSVKVDGPVCLPKVATSSSSSGATSSPDPSASTPEGSVPVKE
jgi:hypothetical protein